MYCSIDDNSNLLIDRNRYMALLQNHGGIFWVPAAKFRSACEIDMRRFPFDQQRLYSNLTVLFNYI